MTLLRNIAFTAVAAIAATTASAENIQFSGPNATLKVHNSSASLETVSGVNELHGRIVAAAARLCGADHRVTTLWEKRVIQRCTVSTVDAYFEQTDLAVLASYNDALGKSSRYNPRHAVAKNWTIEKEAIMADARFDANAK
ncbi:MAG: UrcA family protein [Pseudomonadota bacterium]